MKTPLLITSQKMEKKLCSRNFAFITPKTNNVLHCKVCARNKNGFHKHFTEKAQPFSNPGVQEEQILQTLKSALFLFHRVTSQTETYIWLASLFDTLLLACAC